MDAPVRRALFWISVVSLGTVVVLLGVFVIALILANFGISLRI